MTFARVTQACKTIRQVAGIGLSIERLARHLAFGRFGLAAEDNERVKAVVEQFKAAAEAAVTQIINILNEGESNHVV